MSQQTVLVDLPPDLFQRIRTVAEASNRPLQTVVVESLELLFGHLSDDVESLLPALESMSDEQLWAVVHRRLAWPQDARLRALVTSGAQRTLSADEQAELEVLIDQVDQYTLLRSRALLLLQQRGRNVAMYVKPGA
jgi:hypothetical protein